MSERANRDASGDAPPAAPIDTPSPGGSSERTEHAAGHLGSTDGGGCAHVGGAQALPRAIRTRLGIYRAIAWVVGVLLLALVVVAMPLKYLGDDGTLVAVIGPLHGFCYMVYFVVAVELGFRLRWRWGRLLAVAAAGTIPAVSFVAERFVVRRVGLEGAQHR